jgi:hypothetical protein
MLSSLKKLFSRSAIANAMFGDVVFAMPREQGTASHSFLQWRVKATIDRSQIHVGLAMKADYYAGAEGSPTNYMEFDLETAVRVRDNLNECIEFVRRQGGVPV